MTEKAISLLSAPPEVGHIAFEKSSFDEKVARRARLQLNGEALTPVVFKADTPAIYLCALPGPFVGVNAGETLIVTVQGAARTITIAAVAGKHVSDAAPSEDVTLSTNTTFKIAVDADAIAGTYHAVSIVVTGLDTGAKIATALQAAIRALGGIYAAVTVVFTTVYTISSSKLGTDSRVLIAAGATNDISAELKIGATGVSTSGTGNVANLASITAAEIIAIGMTGIVISETATGELLFTSAVSGRTSKLVTGAGSANAAFGMSPAESSFGAQGMGYDSDMEDTTYYVAATLRGATSLGAKALSINTPTESGFNILCETTAATELVDLIVFNY